MIVNEDPAKNDTIKNIHDYSDSFSYYSQVDHLVDVKDIQNYHNSSYMNNESKNDEPHYHFNLYDNDTNYGWTNHINSCIDFYLCSQICIDSSILSGSDNFNDNYIYNYTCGECGNSSEGKSFDIITHENGNDLTLKESSNDLDLYKHLWVQFKNECEQCEYHLKMSSSDRIKLSIDPGTWGPMDEDMISLDPIEFQSEEELYKDHIDLYQRKKGLIEVIQIGTSKLNGIPIAIEVMGFQFMGVCASGGARMQEGSLSLMQMAKMSSVLYDYQSNKKLFYVSILTSPTTDGVTASFGKRVIEQTLNKTISEGSLAVEYLFHKGLFDPIVSFQLHGFFHLNQNSIK
ncbi:hypothetical protein ES319_D11G251200v1 [Gossypium barbadense]|uniref:CoA carboxyltransferase N-terminal domain-containing protein n=1 Tax=Gossypium barbadense TaxID=3634 RepID=A0A5J5PFC2_GOSBA|nr:hypothetical protein ES319_D11G251200v1 [Gossypium barbadense]